MRYLHLLRCPRCGANLYADSDALHCSRCLQAYSFREEIPLLYWPHEDGPSSQDVTNRVKAFYEANPFPDYEDTDDLATLIEQSKEGIFARLLDEQIPFRSRVLDCGCGTGQLANFLAIAQRSVFGTDICVNSLILAQEFRQKHALERVHFVQMNLFRPVFPSATFDFVICNGVLHHTADPLGGFRILAGLVKPGGYLVVGLYHRFGRVATDLRRLLFRVAGRRFLKLDPRLRQNTLGQSRRSAWFADQYRNPHESTHTIAEVLKWLPASDLDFIKSIPKTRLVDSFSSRERLFEACPAGNALERAVVEFSQITRGAAEGGFFIVIARKR